ncbi:rhamnulokinase [Dactylosporangium aurantiacum]|uniref:Rhamnulokinase n=1 Tax=Dactylosporangium aurantiacum TaxID=35754 RepID=A0A9Q9IC92_9ACTN|nr:rhamnulokinase family protein [Dactylosporangium aurantiacum]MDG6110101.1 FGGY-family carbohydrate kinase [Dactylosporangium aurantiacum]UWZ51352.1 rhamnulokinase [Dactylosporangium aurantiacum]
MPDYLAVDLGAESGRVLRGALRDDLLTVTEVHRFVNRPVALPEGLHWDALALFADLSDGIAAAVAGGSEPVAGVGIDAWGNDFGLLDRAGHLIGNPWHYRDRRTTRSTAVVAARVGAQALYRTTGTPPLPINTASQLVAMEGSPQLDVAERLAMLPDLFGYWLTGDLATEQTIASTSQLLDVTSRTWATGVIDRLGIPRRLFAGGVVPAGTKVGPLLAHPSVPLWTVAGHDTAAAVAAVPATGDGFGYISSGTWSLVGLEIDAPVLTDEARLAGFSNEAGVDGTIRFLRNGTGLWLLQRCRAAWGDPPYADLVDEAAAAPGFRSLVDPDDPAFVAPRDMPARLAAACRASGQPTPQGRGAVVRCVLDSLACKHRWTLERAEALAGRRVDTVHVVGGGAANPLLCQLTADLTGRPVLAGPVEATAVGNLLVQARADGRLGTLRDLRAVVARSLPPRRFEPAGGARHDDAYARFLALLDAGETI